MHLFRLRLILALIACVTVVSLASTYFDVLAHKHFLSEDLERRTGWMGASIQPDLERTIAIGNSTALPALIEQSKARIGALGLAVYGDRGQLLAWAGPASLLPMLPPESLERSLRKGANVSAFGHSEDLQWLEEVLPLHDGNRLEGGLVLLADAGYIRSQGNEVWRRSFWRIATMVIVIVLVTLGMVSWFLMRPMTEVVERLRRLRTG
jgi:trehalose 6-phosphate synthase